MSGKKIIDGLKDAIAGRAARGAVYSNGEAIQRYTDCPVCSGATLTVKGRCDVCGARKIALTRIKLSDETIADLDAIFDRHRS
jgi:hypothetical protein